MSSPHRRSLSRSHNDFNTTTNTTTTNTTTTNVVHNHAFSELVPKIGSSVKSKVRLQQQSALAKITKEKQQHGNSMDWLNCNDNILDNDDNILFNGIKEIEYHDIKNTFITSSKEKHHLIFAEEKGYVFTAKSKSSIKLKPLRKLELGDISIQSMQSDSIYDDIQSSSLQSPSSLRFNYNNNSIDNSNNNSNSNSNIYNDDISTINHHNDHYHNDTTTNNTTNNIQEDINVLSNNNYNIKEFERYNNYLDNTKELSPLSPKIEDKYFGIKSKFHSYATYTELDRKKNIIHGGCNSLSLLINNDNNIISSSVSTLLDNGIISAPPSSRINHHHHHHHHHESLSTNSITEKKRSNILLQSIHNNDNYNDNNNNNNNDNILLLLPEPTSIETTPNDRFLFDFFIISCSHLIKADIIGTSDPIVKVYFNDVYIAETSCMKNTLNPVWDDLEKFEINIPYDIKVRDCKLDLEVYDLDKFDDPDFLGGVTFQGKDLLKFIKSENGTKIKPSRNNKMNNQRSHRLGISSKHPSRDLQLLDHFRLAHTSIVIEISTYDNDILNNEDDESTVIQSINEIADVITENDDNDKDSIGMPYLNLDDNDDLSDFNYRFVDDLEPKEVDNFIDDTYSTFGPKSPRAQFLVGCLANNVPPTTVGLLRKRISNTINLAHMTLGDKLATLFAECIDGIPTVESLILCDNNLSGDSLSVIMNKIKVLSRLKILDISCNILGAKAAALLQHFLSDPECPLKCLILKDTNLDDIELSRFVLALKDNIRIEDIDLSKNLLGRDENKHITPDFIGAGGSISDLLMNSNIPLKRLNLEWNSLHSDNALAICDSISMNTTLQSLNLSVNTISREGALSLANALIKTKSIEELILATCSIDCIGCFALVINAKECGTLKCLNLDNNPIGNEAGRAILHVADKCGDRLQISCATCDMNSPCPDDAFQRKNIINTYKLNLADVYERAIAVHVLDLVAGKPSLGIHDVVYSDVEGNNDEITLYRGISGEQLVMNHQHIDESKLLGSDVTKARKTFRQMDESGFGLDQNQFFEFLSVLNFNVSRVDATFANFTMDPHHNIKRIDENEAINFIVYLNNEVIATQENMKQERYTLCKLESNKKLSHFVVPIEGILSFTVKTDHFISRNYGIVSKKGLNNMMKIALKSKNPMETLLYIVDSHFFFFDEAKDYVALLKKQTGDICLTLSLVLPKMVTCKDARRLLNCFISNNDQKKLIVLERLLGSSYQVILGKRNGFYSLNLSNHLDRRAIELLFAHSRNENEKRKAKNLWDISQYMQWNGFRNMYVNGQHVIPNDQFFHPLPTKGDIEFDYIDIAKPDHDIIPLNDNSLISIALESKVLYPSQIDWANQKLTHMGHSAAYIFDESDLMHFKKIKKDYQVGVSIGSICITLVSCSNLENKDKGKNGKSDPFVIISILDKSVESKHVLNDLNPIFNDLFELEWDGISPLMINVWDEDFSKENDHLGDLSISLATLDFSNDKKIKINRLLENATNGNIFMELSFKPKIDVIGTIIIHLISCNNLICADKDQEDKGIGTSDPYVVMSIGLNRCESKHIFNCLDPVFDETFELDFDGVSPLYCQVWDDDLNKFDDPLGDILIDIGNFVKHPDSKMRLRHQKLVNIKHGTITMDITFKPKWNPIGKLSMKYISCRDLENKDGAFGISDPYLVFKCGPNRIHTKVQMNTLNPVFDGIYDMDWDGKVPLVVEVWDQDDNSIDDSLGEILIHVEHYNFRNGRRVLKVLDKKLSNIGWGKITMDILFYPSIARLNEAMDLKDHDFVPNKNRAFSICKNMEKLSGHAEFLKRKGKLGIVDKKEQNIPLTTTEATIDEDFEDDYRTFTANNIVTNTESDSNPADDANSLSLVHPDLKPSNFIGASSPESTPASPKEGTPVGTPVSRQSPSSNNKEIIASISQQASPLIGSRKGIVSPSAAIDNKPIEITDECKCASILKQIESSLESRLIFSRHLALILEAFHIGQTARSNYGSYRVELIIRLFHQIVDLQNFGFVLALLNPREYSQIVIRVGYLNFFNPFFPQGYYYIDHSQWDHRQLMKIIMLIHHYEPNSSSINDLVFKQINNREAAHDAIANNPHNDHDLEHTELKQVPAEQHTHVTDLLPWYEEHSFPKEGALSLNFLCADTTSEQIEMNFKRFSLLPLLLLDHDEVTRVVDTNLPILHNDVESYRHYLSHEVRLSRKNAIENAIINVVEESDNQVSEIFENVLDDFEQVENFDNKEIAIDIVEETVANEIDNVNENIEGNEDIEGSNEEVAASKAEENLEYDIESETKVEIITQDEVPEVPVVRTYQKTTVDQINNYVHDKTEFQWNFTFIDSKSDEEDIDADDGFDL